MAELVVPVEVVAAQVLPGCVDDVCDRCGGRADFVGSVTYAVGGAIKALRVARCGDCAQVDDEDDDPE